MKSKDSIRVLVITSQWPTAKKPDDGIFIKQEVDNLSKAGVDIEVFPFKGKKNPLNYLRNWVKLRGVYDISSFDLIHAQFGQSGLLALPTEVPLVVTFRGSDLHGIMKSEDSYMVTGKVLRFLSRWVARYAKEVIVVSEQLLSYLSPDLSTHIIPSGVDLSLFYPMPQPEARKQLGLPQDKYLVLFVSIEPYAPVKRYYLAQSAIDLLKNRFDVELITVSDMLHSSVPIYMNACDALLLTSGHEGSPNVIKEALACNLPIVSVDVGDVRQRMGKLQGCVVCPDDSPESITAALTKVLKSRKRIQGRDAVLDLDIRLTTQKIIDVYRSALGKV